MAEERTLEITPSWAVASVCFILIFVSIFLEHLISLVAEYFNKKKRKALIQAVDKIKSELMLLGFISLFLTISEKQIANICIPKRLGESFLPCGGITSSYESEEETKCQKKGMVSLLSRSGVRELQSLIFILAFFHSLSCMLIFCLGMAKMRRWETWEAETRTVEYQFSKDPRRFQLTHQTSFGRRHLNYWSVHPILHWPTCFLRQFCFSVSKVDYLTLRHGFVTAHFDQENNFDFQNYIQRALDKDFGVVVEISSWIWTFLLFFIFFNAHAFYSYLWLPFIPLVTLFVVGTKLQGIITSMCVESHNKSQVVQGTLLVRPSDHFFWFGKPKLLLHLIHFVVFQNSFQIAFFVWTWVKFGFRSCFHKETEDIVIRLIMGVIIHFLCGYVTLPLYALVTQMGTSMSTAVFNEEVAIGLKRWRDRARKNLKNPYSGHRSLDTSLSLETTDTNLTSSTPSFSLDASYTVKTDSPLDSKQVTIEMENEKEDMEKQHHKMGSFQGFYVNNNITSDSENKSN